nr:integrase, catalytic region, zinc finger, CCHC-type, peptidase aspartic, catalytic [Tanacetum cinerariifolium]
HNSILNGPYVRRMIPKLGDANREIKADDQAIQTILFGFPEDIYAAVDSCETAQEIWLRFQQMMKGSDIRIQDKKAKLFNEWERFTFNEGESIESYYHPDYTQLYDFLKYNQKEVDELKAERLAKTQDPLALMANSNNPYALLATHQDQSSFNPNYLQQPMPNPKDITDPTTAMNMALALMAKAFKLNYSTPTNNNQRISSNPRNKQIAQPGMNMGQDRKTQMVGGNGENQFRQYAWQNTGNLNGYNVVQNVGNQNQIGNGNLVAVRAEGNVAGQNGNQIRCYNCGGVGHYARNCTVRPSRRDAAYLQTQLLIAQKEEQASTSGTQTDSAPVYDSNRSAENNNNVISEVTSVEQVGETVQQHSANFGETHALYESLYQNLAIEVEKVNSVNRKLKETNAGLTTELARYKNQESQFLREAAKFVGDFKSLANEADASLAKHKALELEIERLLKAVVSQDIISVVQNTTVVDTSVVQTELQRTQERFENCIIKKENEYAKLWNDWYKKCDECKYDKISYDKAYKDMQQKIERLQAQLGDLKGKSKDTSCVSDTFNPLSQKLENENVELEFQVLNYARENAHLKATYNTIYKNAKLQTQLFKKVSDQKDIACETSANTKFAKQSTEEILPKLDEIHALSKPVTSNSVSTPQESKGLNNEKVIATGMFKITPFKTSWEEKHMPNTVRVSDRTKPITISQPSVITKKDVNSDVNGLSSTGVDNTKTRRPQPRSNTKNDRVPSASKSSQSQNKEAEVEEHHRNLLLSKNNKHTSSACNNINLDTQDVISKVVYVTCKQCLISVNHDVCLRNYVNGKTSRGRKYQPKAMKPKKGKIVDSSESESQSDCSNDDNACTSNSLEPKIKRFPNSTSLLVRLFRSVYGASNLGCSRHMTRNLKLLINFVWKFMGTVRFKNDHVDAILGFGDLQWGNILNTRVYFVKGLGHNLFSVGQFCDSDLEVTFRRNTCFVKKLEGVDLLKGDRSTNLYTINLHKMASVSPIYLMARASSTKSWLWHQRLSHLNFDTINDLAINDLFSVISQDIMIIIQNESVVDTSDLQTELERMKERFENAIIKKKTEYSKLWNDWRVSDQKDNTQDSSKNTKFAKQPNVEILPKIGETNALSKPVTSNSVSTPQVSKGVNNSKVIAPGMFKISPDNISREAKHVPNTVSASSRTKPITVSQPSVITKKDMNSDVNGLSSTGVDNTKTRRPQPRSNTKNDRIPFAS